jgi:cysteine-rich repeat protein
MRLDRVVFALGLASCTFDSTGLDVTSAAGETGTVGVMTGATTGTVTTGTAAETTGDTPTGSGGSGESTVGLTTTEPPDTGDTTQTAGSSSGSSTDGPPGVCGDGTVDAGEACDDGNMDGTDACTSQCKPAVCGDGFVQAGVETCDDANADETDACTNMCLAPACDDLARNGDESDVDCGGSCPDCPTGKMCGVDDDCVGNCDGATCVDFRSCLELKMNQPGAPSDVYTIDPDQGGPGAPFAVYCAQLQDDGGWTMVLKVDGRKSTFLYGSALWSNANTLNPDPLLNRVETKLQSFSTVPMTEMLVGIETPISQDGQLKLKYVKLSAPGTSAQALFMGNQYLASNLGRDQWKMWIPDSSLQLHCNREGLNVSAPFNASNYARVRIGIIANENGPGDCNTPNSYIGVGGGGTGVCVPNAITTTGNRAGCDPDNGDKDIPGFAVVFVR